MPFPLQSAGFGLIPAAASGGGGGTDPYFANVASLLHFDGADGSTTITDVTGKAWAAAGNAQLDTAQSMFGGSSLLLDGSGDYVSAGSHADFGFGAGDYTIEGFARVAAATGGVQTFFDNRTAANDGISIFATDVGGTTGRVSVGSNTAFIITSASSAYALNTWFHLALVRDGTTLYLYIGGVAAGSVTDSRTYASASSAFIGSQYNVSAHLNGHVDEFRATKGVCRYPGGVPFTPPTAAFPDS